MTIIDTRRILSGKESPRNVSNTRENAIPIKSYGGFFGVAKDGVMYEEGTAVEGCPAIFYNDTIVCLNAKTAEIADIYIIEDSRRKCIAISDLLDNARRSCMGLALHSNYGGNPAVGNWNHSKVEFGLGKLKESKETLDKSIKVEAEVFLPLKHTVTYKAIIYNNGNKKLTGDLVFNFFLKDLTQLPIYPDFQANENATILQIKGKDNYTAVPDAYMVIKPDKKISHHLEALDILPPDATLPLPLSDSSLPLLCFNPVQVYQQIPVEIKVGGKEEICFVISYGKEAKVTLEKANKALDADLEGNSRSIQKYWSSKNSWVKCANPLTDSLLKYILMLVETDFEPNGRCVCDLSGWGWGPATIENKEWFSTMDTAIALLDLPFSPNLTPEYFKKIFSYTVDQENKRLKEEVIFRVRYEHYLRYPIAVYQYYLATLDKDFLIASYEILKNSLLFLKKHFTNKNHLLTIGVGYYDVFTYDGGMNEDGKSVFAYQQILAAEALKAIADIAHILKHKKDKEDFLFWRRQIRAGIRTLWNGEYYSFTLEHDNFDVFANMWAMILGMVEDDRMEGVVRHLLWTGTGFPQLHPPFPKDTWFRDNPPYSSLQNGAMYSDVLGLVASASNLVEDRDLLKKVFFVWNNMLTRYKYLLVSCNPWSPQFANGTYRSEIHSLSSFVRSFFSGAVGLRREGRNFALKPLMIDEVGNLITINKFLWGGSTFNINIHRGIERNMNMTIDGMDIPSEIIPASFYNGKNHEVILRSGVPQSPYLLSLGAGCCELEDVTFKNEKLILKLKKFSRETTTIKTAAAGKLMNSVQINGKTVKFTQHDDICSFELNMEDEKLTVIICFA